MNVGFISFDRDRNDKTGSARIRVHNLVKYEPSFERFAAGKKYEAVVFQKYYWLDYAQLFDGVKILDVCDPDWLQGNNATQVKQMIEYCDGIVANTDATAEYIKLITDKPVKVIPDRHDMAIFKEKKIHKGTAKSVVWFGYSHNAHVLELYVPKLLEMGLKLTIISDKHVSAAKLSPEYKAMENFVKWPDTIEEVNKELIKHDFALLPVRRRPQEQYKSNNKNTHAWAVGLPVANWGDDIDRLMDEAERIKDQEEHFESTKRDYDCKLSVQDLKDFINEIKDTKNI